MQQIEAALPLIHGEALKKLFPVCCSFVCLAIGGIVLASVGANSEFSNSEYSRQTLILSMPIYLWFDLLVVFYYALNGSEFMRGLFMYVDEFREFDFVGKMLLCRDNMSQKIIYKGDTVLLCSVCG